MLYRSAHMSRRPRNYARLVSIFLLASSLAFAQPADAPVDLPKRSVRLDTGQAAPFSGRLLSDEEHTASEAKCADDHAFRAKAMGGVLLPPAALVAVVLGALALGAAVSAGVAVAVKR